MGTAAFSTSLLRNLGTLICPHKMGQLLFFFFKTNSKNSIAQMGEVLSAAMAC